ncbi:MAG: hypothetical protein HYS27_19070 [Deltaproteobacteria bacterium]|nr:hypothetical protein [Deltaproteobacteria bacterium]
MTPAIAILAVGVLGLAEHDRVSFALIRGDGVERCTDEASLRERVAQRIGSEPFAADEAGAARHLRVGLERVDAATIEARVALFAGDGAPLGKRVLRGAADCTTLTDELVLAVAIAIDPLLLLRPTPPIEAIADHTEPPSTPATIEVAPTEGVEGTPAGAVDASAGLTLPLPEAYRGRLVAAGSAGVGPAMVPSLRLGLALDFGTVSAEAALRVDLPARVPVAAGAFIDLTLLALDAGACVEGGIEPAGLRACGALQAGALAAQATGFSSTVATTTPWIALAARGAVVLQLVAGAALLVEGELAVPMVRARFVDERTGSTLAEPAAVVGALGAGVELELR